MTRSTSWFVVDQAVRVAVGEPDYPEFTGQMIQLSTTGIRLRADRPLRLGLAVELSWNGTIVSGKVRKCLVSEFDFLIECGLERVVKQGPRAQTATAPSV